MTDLIDRLVPGSDYYDRRKSGQDISQPPRRNRREAAIAMLVTLGLVGVLGGVALAGADRWRQAPAATVSSGESLLVLTGERWSRLVPGDGVREGARVQTGGSQTRLRLGDGEVWLGPETGARIFSDRVEVLRGEALIASQGRLGARWADVEVWGAGTFRVAGGTHPHVGVYQGDAEVRRPGETRALSALEQMELDARRLPAEPDPLAYRTEDPWDARLLGQAIVFDQEVERVVRSIDLRFADTPRSSEYYRGFKAVDSSALDQLRGAGRDIASDGRFGPPSEVLITLFVARATAQVWERTLPDTVSQVVQWRAQGARWGLVALRSKVTVADLRNVVDLSRVDPIVDSPPRPLASEVAGAERSLPTQVAALPATQTEEPDSVSLESPEETPLEDQVETSSEIGTEETAALDSDPVPPPGDEGDLRLQRDLAGLLDLLGGVLTGR
ncbi:MAG: hypothetical protein ACRDZO_18035 [Egibacteraceae bacterium]